MSKKELDNEDHRRKRKNFKQEGRLLLELQEGGYKINDSTVSNVLSKRKQMRNDEKAVLQIADGRADGDVGMRDASPGGGK